MTLLRAPEALPSCLALPRPIPAWVPAPWGPQLLPSICSLVGLCPPTLPHPRPGQATSGELASPLRDGLTTMALTRPKCPRPSGLGPPGEHILPKSPQPWWVHPIHIRALLGPLGDSGHPGPGKGTWPESKQKAPVSQGTKRQEGPRHGKVGGDRQGLGQAGPAPR